MMFSQDTHVLMPLLLFWTTGTSEVVGRVNPTYKMGQYEASFSQLPLSLHNGMQFVAHCSRVHVVWS